MMIELVTIVTAGAVAYGLVRVLHWTIPASRPQLYYQEPVSPLIEHVINECPIVTEIQSPPWLWGRCGHLQTLLSNVIRWWATKPEGKRYHIVLPDGATMSFDVYEPLEETPDDNVIFTLCVCPGMTNTCETKSLRTLVRHAQERGYRVAVLNHLGCLRNENLTAPRMFTYGSTEEYGTMVDAVLKLYPTTRLMAVGLSMGGNLVCKYLGEDSTNQQKFLCGMSVCQGYNIEEAFNLYLAWTGLTRLYAFGMTIRMKSILRRHSGKLFADERLPKFDLTKLFASTALSHIDEHYTSLRLGFPGISEYYRNSSSVNYMANVHIPVLIVNAKDDPICPDQLLRYPQKHAAQNPNCLFVLTRHGGHLGFFEGGFALPNLVTWLDRAVVQYADSIRKLYIGSYHAEKA